MSEIDIFVSSTGNFQRQHFGRDEVEAHFARGKHRTLSQRDRLRSLRGLGRHESRQHQTSEDYFVFPVAHGDSAGFRPARTDLPLSEGARRESGEIAPSCTAELTVFAQEHADYTGVKVEGPFKGGHFRYRAV